MDRVPSSQQKKRNNATVEGMVEPNPYENNPDATEEFSKNMSQNN